MELWKKVCIGFVGLSFAGGCMAEKSQKPAPTQVIERPEVYSDETSKLVNEVVRLTERAFPRGGVIDIGKNYRGNSRYVSIKVNNHEKVLDTVVYIGVDEALDKKVGRLLSDHDYAAASKVLKESEFEVAQFYDSNFDGYKSPDDEDFIRTKNLTEMYMPGTNLRDVEFTKGYQSILNIIKPYLEAQLKKAG